MRGNSKEEGGDHKLSFNSTHHGPSELSPAEDEANIEGEVGEEFPGGDAGEEKGKGGEDVCVGAGPRLSVSM
jgi:hypothetical protein